jgi:RNA 2',3'-cyclic 3'-phosphodiesterase
MPGVENKKVKSRKLKVKATDFAVRLFVAISLSAELRASFSALLQELRPLAPLAKFVPAGNLHLTLKFLGEVSQAKLDEVRSALSTIHSQQPARLDFRALAFFPNERHPKVLWVDVESTASLKSLAADIDRAMHTLGFPLETRDFTPHLTLARFYKPGLPPKLRIAVNENASRTFGSLTTADFHLIESKRKPSGAEYTVLETFPFVAS